MHAPTLLCAVYAASSDAVVRGLRSLRWQVRSLELDTKEWSAPLLSMMTLLGNESVNAIWHPEHSAATRDERPTADTSPAARESYIRRKYETRAFTSEEGIPEPNALHRAAATNDVVLAVRCLAHRFDMDAPAPPNPSGPFWGASEVAAHSGRSALQVAAACGSEEVLELLLQNMASTSRSGVDGADEVSGKTALRLAVEAAHAGCVHQLITRGANISHADSAQQTPMQVAVELGHVEISEAMLAYKLAQDEKLLRQIDVGDAE